MAAPDKNTITLRGSTETVAEFFQFALSSILFQRGIYPAEAFEPRAKYGLTVMAVADPKLSGYLASVLRQFADWLGTGTLRKAVLVVAAAATGEVRERWAFDIQTAAGALGGAGAAALPEKSAAAVAAEVQAMIRQITASVTFLPLLGDACTIDLLAYTDREGDVPLEWEESDPRLIAGGEDVRLRSFSTAAHAVEALVSYRCE